MVFITTEKHKKTKKSTIHNHFATTGWYLIFLFIIPYSIINLFSFNHLRFYFPIIDLIANSFSASGSQDELFKDLYSLSPNNLISFLSTNFINLIALIGVSWNGILHAFHYKSLWAGVMVTVFMYIITYLIPTQMIPYVIETFQGKIDEISPDYLKQKSHITIFGKTLHIEDYIAGAILIIILVFIEYFFVQMYIKTLKNL